MEYVGKYRGKVIDPRDPSQLGRVRVRVPVVHENLDNSQLPWAMPCSPYAGKDIGFFMIPPASSSVWVEFEAGEPDRPIWSGCFWEPGELPKNAQLKEAEKVQVFRTEGITFTWSNHGDNKGVSLEVESPVVNNPLRLVFNADGIELNNNNETTIRLKANEIQIDNGGGSTIVLTTRDIQLKEQATTTKLTANSIELSSTPASATFGSAGIELKHGAAAIALNTATVNVNNGALEVI